MKKNHSDKQQFSERLKQALLSSTGSISSTKLAIQFNFRYPKTPISTQSAHKWLNGQTIPTKDKIQVLAKWLNVSEFWLHYGSSATNNSINFNHKVAHKPLTMQLSPLEQQILLLFRELSESQSKLVYELIYELSRKSFGKNFSANSNQNENSNESINV